MAGYLRRLTPYRRVGGYISGGSAAQPGSYPTTTSAVWSLDDLYLRRVGPLLDSYPNAAAAYSLRSLTSAYTGPVVTVRRSTDSAEAEFTASEVSDGTLAAWCSGGDGFVKTWHDQSQNGRDASQATAAAQPQIVDSGSLVTEGGNAALSFDGVDDTLSVSAAFIGTADVSFASVQTLATLASVRTVFYAGDPSINADYITVSYDSSVATYRIQCRAGSGGAGQAFSSTNAEPSAVLFSTRVGTTSQIYANGATDSAVTDGENGVDVSGTLFLMNFRAIVPVQGTMQEFIIYPVDQSANRVGIEDNINSHYSVF